MLSGTERVWRVAVNEAQPALERDGSIYTVTMPEETPLLSAAIVLAEAVRGTYADGGICMLCGGQGAWGDPHGPHCPAGLYGAELDALGL